MSDVSTEGIENWITTGGGGGTSTQEGQQGNSDVFDWVDGGGGKQGGVSSPRGGESSMPIVFRGTRWGPWCAFDFSGAGVVKCTHARAFGT